jgi:hypothetical protein
VEVQLSLLVVLLALVVDLGVRFQAWSLAVEKVLFPLIVLQISICAAARLCMVLAELSFWALQVVLLDALVK